MAPVGIEQVKIRLVFDATFWSKAAKESDTCLYREQAIDTGEVRQPQWQLLVWNRQKLDWDFNETSCGKVAKVACLAKNR